jgi:hypothetical protein
MDYNKAIDDRDTKEALEPIGILLLLKPSSRAKAVDALSTMNRYAINRYLKQAEADPTLTGTAMLAEHGKIAEFVSASLFAHALRHGRRVQPDRSLAEQIMSDFARGHGLLFDKEAIDALMGVLEKGIEVGQLLWFLYHLLTKHDVSAAYDLAVTHAPDPDALLSGGIAYDLGLKP